MTEETTLSLRISSLFAGRSLLDFHTQRFKYQTCEKWKLEIGRGKVTVNGKTATADYLLSSAGVGLINLSPLANVLDLPTPETAIIESKGSVNCLEYVLNYRIRNRSI